jgi:hypothetical protein
MAQDPVPVASTPQPRYSVTTAPQTTTSTLPQKIIPEGIVTVTGSEVAATLAPSKDPYDTPGERAEGFFVGKIIGKFTGETDGFCSTYREWHILLAGIWAGMKAAQFADIPECPEYWADEAQYYHGGALVSNVAKIYGTSAGATLAGVFLWLNSSGLLKLVGIS